MLHIPTYLGANCSHAVVYSILLGPKAKPIMKLLHSQLVVIEAFCSRLETLTAKLDLSKGQQMKSKEYKMLVEHYLVFQEIQAVFAKGNKGI